MQKKNLFLEMPTAIGQLKKVYMLGVWISPPIATFLGTPVLVLIETSTFPIVVFDIQIVPFHGLIGVPKFF